MMMNFRQFLSLEFTIAHSWEPQNIFDFFEVTFFSKNDYGKQNRISGTVIYQST